MPAAVKLAPRMIPGLVFMGSICLAGPDAIRPGQACFKAHCGKAHGISSLL